MELCLTEDMILQEADPELQLLTPEQAQLMFHELRVQQVELEMQNEELRRAQHELEASRSRYFSLYDLAPIGYLTINDQKLIIEANLNATKLLGVARHELLKKPITSFILPEDQDICYLARKRVFATGELQEFDLRMVRADGSCFWVRIQAVPAGDGECWVTLEDLTERKKAAEEKLAIEQQFQQAQKMESLGVLAGGIAHDFNNILTIIMANCSLARKKPETACDYLLTIENAANRAAELCRQMQAYAGKAQLVQTKINMAALVDDMLKMLSSNVNKNIRIKCDLATDIPFIMGDAGQLRQVIMNLILNASEAIGTAQGEICVTLAKAEVKDGDLNKDHLGKVIPPGRYICLEVADSGYGMDDETKRRLFEPFYSTKFAGRGLGLAATLGIIAAHKGGLQLSSQPDAGATFIIYLPVCKTNTEDAESIPPVLPEKWQGSGTILLVDDEEQIRMVAKAMLETLGFAVVEASNGKEALAVYQENIADIDMVMTDIGMPIMDGYELFSELKKFDSELPIIVSSGFGDAAVLSRIALEDTAGFLCKPYSFDQLQKLLKDVVGKLLPSR